MNTPLGRQRLARTWLNPAPSTAFTRWRNGIWLSVLYRTGITLEWLGRRFVKSTARPQHLIVGERGEEIVYWHLQRQGWMVLARRWRRSPEHGDLDLIALDGSTLSFIEVKTRTSRGMVPAQLAVDQGKRRMLRKMARLYIRSLPREVRPTRTRFDVVVVYLIPGEQEAIELRRNAFGWSERRRSSRYWED
jgi:putative endonuclease